MSKIRVLIVDDSAVIRKLLTSALTADPELDVVGAAANGQIGLAKIDELAPDVVTLDVEMPVLDGLQTLVELRKKHPRLPVIMFSSLTERGATVTLNALFAGANDYVAKPSNAGSFDVTVERIRSELAVKIKALVAKRRGAAARPARPVEAPLPAPNAAPTGAIRNPALAPVRDSGRRGPIDILAIGTSTGGPNALAAVLPSLTRLPIPTVIVQHMPPVFTRHLADRLSEQLKFPVFEAKEGDVLEAGKAWIAPGDYHMELVREKAGVRISLNQAAPENFCRPAVDVLFRSVARVGGGNTLAVVMTGMGQDGLVGCRAIKEAGGRVLIQDEASSVVWGMPGAVSKAGLANQTLPLSDLGPAIERLIRTSAGPR